MCVHEYYKSWTGKCEGGRLTPLSANLPDPRIRGLASEMSVSPRPWALSFSLPIIQGYEPSPLDHTPKPDEAIEGFGS